jgi:hypothetical protein
MRFTEDIMIREGLHDLLLLPWTAIGLEISTGLVCPKRYEEVSALLELPGSEVDFRHRC